MKGAYNLTIYLTPEEHAWVKAQEPGYVRLLIQEDMPEETE